MTDLSKTISPKSDQCNADDLISGPRTIKVTGVKGMAEKEQPIAIYFEGDEGKPYKPCKSMRRVMVMLWGSDGNQYAGRSMTLYNDPTVKFGGIAVGGIRISHMSHIEKETTLALTTTKAQRKPFTVKPLVIDNRPASKPATAAKIDPQAPDLGQGGTGTSDFPIYNSAGQLVQHCESIEEWCQFFTDNLPKIKKVESIEKLQQANMATFVTLNEKGFSTKVGEVKSDIAARKHDLQNPATDDGEF